MGCINRSKVYTPSSFPGSKSLSTSRHGQGSGKMSSKHGTNSGNPTKGMSNASGRIGARKESFSRGEFKQGPCPIGKKY